MGVGSRGSKKTKTKTIKQGRWAQEGRNSNNLKTEENKKIKSMEERIDNQDKEIKELKNHISLILKNMITKDQLENIEIVDKSTEKDKEQNNKKLKLQQ